MKTKKIVNKSISLRKTIKKKQNGSGFFDKIKERLSKNKTPKPILYTTPMENRATETQKVIEIVKSEKNKYIEILEHKIKIQLAFNKLKKELDALQEQSVKTKRDADLINNIKKDMARLKNESEKFKKSDQADIKAFNKENTDINSLSEKISELEELHFKLTIPNELNNNIKEKYASYLNNKIYKKYSRLFNNIERNKKQKNSNKQKAENKKFIKTVTESEAIHSKIYKYDLLKHLYVEQNLIELLKNKKELELAKKKLEEEKQELNLIDEKNQTNEDKILFNHINTNIKNIQDKIKELEDEIIIETDKDNYFFPMSDLDIDTFLKEKYNLKKEDKFTLKQINKLKDELNLDFSTLNKDIIELNKEIISKIYEKISGLSLKIRQLKEIPYPKVAFNNNTKAVYKKYPQFRKSLFNNIDRNKKEITARKQDIIEQNKAKFENIHKEMIKNREEIIIFYKKIDKNNKIIKMITDIIKQNNQVELNKESDKLLDELVIYRANKNKENLKCLDNISNLNDSFSALKRSLNDNISSEEIKRLKDQIDIKNKEIAGILKNH